ncbi:MAG: hypothetical protein U0L83_02420, partial [Muribaculaceae bacterium]|nr:hypothetical protein [Muribaculaceae bacterium]
IRKNIEFGFEGFFSLAEKGEWQSNSNDILRDMLVFPDNVKTWLIGDGYAANPLDNTSGNADPYYTGPSFHGFYMQTDIGYCRVIFYFGVVGLCILLGLFITTTKLLVRRFYEYKIMFILLLCINLIGWCKVSTDIFVVFAPFLCISCDDNDKEMCLTNV